MRVKFVKQETVDYQDVSMSEVVDRTFQRNEVIDVTKVEENTRNFVNLNFDNGDVAIGIPRQSLILL